MFLISGCWILAFVIADCLKEVSFPRCLSSYFCRDWEHFASNTFGFPSGDFTLCCIVTGCRGWKRDFPRHPQALVMKIWKSSPSGRCSGCDKHCLETRLKFSLDKIWSYSLNKAVEACLEGQCQQPVECHHLCPFCRGNAQHFCLNHCIVQYKYSTIK